MCKRHTTSSCKIVVFVYITTPIACYPFIYHYEGYIPQNATDDEKNLLHLMLEDKESGYKAKIILLKDEWYTVPPIRKITNHHDHNIRKWIHRFNEKGIDDIISKKYNHKQHKFDNAIEKQIVVI